MEATMKSFKEYLTESKKVYEFKVKIAGDIPKDFANNLKIALAQFNVESIKNAKRTPMQESPIDFPNVKFREVTVFDVAVSYPSNSPMIAKTIHEHMGIDSKHIVVRTIGESEETLINTQFMFGLETTPEDNPDEALLNTPYEASNNQNLVGEEHKLSFLKSLEKHDLEKVEGINAQLFPAEAKGEKQQLQPPAKDNLDSLLTKQMKLSPMVSDRHYGIGKGK